MAPQPLSAEQLARTPTLFASFMGHEDPGYKTVAELLDIYRQRSAMLHASDDRDDHLRVERFMSDMTHSRWDTDLVVQIGVFDDSVHLIDGTHRSLAYLACLQDGIGAERLPALQVDC